MKEKKSETLNKVNHNDEAFQQWELSNEKYINFFRAGLVFTLLTMDFVVAMTQTQIDFRFIYFILATLVIVGLYSYLIHYLVSGNRYHNWLKYIIIAVDCTFVFLSYFEVKETPFLKSLPPIALTEAILIIFILINMLGVFRHGIGAVIFSTFLVVTYSTILSLLSSEYFIITIWGPMMVFLSGVLVAGISINRSNFYHTAREQEKLQRFLSPQVIDAIQSGQVSMELGGNKMDVTVLLCDIRGFTSLSERYDAQIIVGMLNEYFTAMTEVIFSYGGTVDKYIGDAILAVFGAPLPMEDSAIRALNASRDMLIKLKELNKKFLAQDLPGLHIGIAIHAGEVVAGNIGSPQKMDYTIIGDTVNITCRIETLNKTYSTQILLTEATRDQLKNLDNIHYVADTAIRGKVNEIKLFTTR